MARLRIYPDAVDPADCDETPLPRELPRAYAQRIAAEKAQAVAAQHAGAIIIAADTVVAAGRRILPKAETLAQAQHCLEILSGRRHRVLTAVCVVDTAGRARHKLSETTLSFKRLSPTEMASYLANGEWQGKAGGYAIQGYAESFIRALSGSYSGVVGLPLFETRAMLCTAGYGTEVMPHG